MAVSLSFLGGAAAQFFDDNGTPLSGGKIYTYSAGTTTPLSTYTDNTGGVAHPNPIILDAAGRVPGGEIWVVNNTQYKFVIKTSADVLIATYDNIYGSNLTAANIPATANYAGAVQRTQQSVNDDRVSVFDFLTAAQITAVKNGSSSEDLTSAVQAAINTQKRVYFPGGTYKFNVQINNKTILEGDGSLKTIVKPYNDALAVFTYTYTAQQNPLYRFWDYHSEIRNIGFFSNSAKIGVGFTFAQTAPASYQTNDQLANNVKFFGCYFEGFDKAIQFPFGNIGTEIYSCGFTSNKYGIYTLNNKFGGTMHCGNKYIFAGEFHDNECAIYANNDPQGIVLYGTILEFNQIVFYGYFDATSFIIPVTFNDCWMEGNGVSNTGNAATTVTVDTWSGTTKSTTTINRHAVYTEGSRGYLQFNRCFFTDAYIASTYTTVKVNDCRIENNVSNGGGPSTIVSPSTSSIIMDTPYTNYGFLRDDGCEVIGRPSFAFYDISSVASYSAARWYLTPPRTAKMQPAGNVASAVNFTSPVSTGNGSFNLTGTLVNDGRIFSTCNEFTRAAFASTEYTAVNSPTSFFTTTAGWYVYSFDVKRISGNVQFNVWNRGNAQLAINIQPPVVGKWFTVAGLGYSPGAQTMYLDMQGLNETATWRLSAWQALRFDTLAEAQDYLSSLAYADGAFTGSVSTTSAVAATIFTAGTEGLATYIVSAGISGAAPATYSAISLITASGSTLRTTALQTATTLSIGISGQTIQVTQTSGSAQTVIYSITKIAQIF